MSGDEKLIRELLDRTDREYGLWHEPPGCRTEDGELCLRALAVDLAGGRWAGEAGGDLGEWVEAEPDDNPDHVRHIIHIHDRADRIIGVDLGERWTPAKLRRLLRS